MSLTSQAYSIQSIYEWYRKEMLIVNRRYQRKLVWSLKEKKMLVDSVLQDFPLPLFLLSKKGEKYEIIDGMQRLNSIFAFIEGEFPIFVDDKEGYFDLSTLGSTKDLLDQGKLQQKIPILDRSLCVDFSNYQLAISIVETKDEEQIDEIFRRINSYGKHLSAQEIRQAGALGRFPDLVRRLSSTIRRDSSPNDTLTLGNMQKISLSIDSLKYGIRISDVFWIKHGIITSANLRSSRDGELIAHLLIKLLDRDNYITSANYLNKVYVAPKEQNSIDAKIQLNKNIEEEFEKVFEGIEHILSCTDKSLAKIFYPTKKPEEMPIMFQILFLSMYELMVVDEKGVKNPVEIVKRIEGFGENSSKQKGARRYNPKIFKKQVQMLKGLIADCFEKSISQTISSTGIMKVEQILQEAKVEQPLYDFKIGLYSITNPQKEASCISKIVKTLTAMGNTKPRTEGYVLLGIADKEEDARQLHARYSTEIKEFNGHYIVGIEDEAKAVHGNLDSYLQHLKQMVEKENVSKDVHSHILREMQVLDYHGRILVLLTFSSDKPISYDRKYFERRGAHIHELSLEEVVTLTQRFN